MKRPRVLFLTAGLFQYRTRFHTVLRRTLADEEIDYCLAISPPKASDAQRNTFAELDFVIPVRDIRVSAGSSELIYQRAARLIYEYDLVILTQESKFLLNFLLGLIPRGLRPISALFGHGRNFQADSTLVSQCGELMKRFITGRFDWWFAYNQLSVASMIAAGADPARITNVQNAFDTWELREHLQAARRAKEHWLPQKGEFNNSHAGLFIGSLYPVKRIDFLLKAADLIKAREPRFSLIVAGDGPLRTIVHEAATTRPWLHAVGAVQGLQKADLLSQVKVLLMPGGVGLVVLDAFEAGLPLVTTENNLHGPEIEYLSDGLNGIITRPGDDVGAYADSVVMLLQDDEKRRQMSVNARNSAEAYSVEEMANRFAAGISKALDWGTANRRSLSRLESYSQPRRSRRL